jgi:hypothetical protein
MKKDSPGNGLRLEGGRPGAGLFVPNDMVLRAAYPL